ncbi:hypothetical protein A7318_26450 [Pseudomonas lurida]|uniref:hypothetical protein n=1 Tax=Pseudomonas lurida TaxID=244566 RepID=UPI00083E487A|nr:hypothetical protein [Pseudomonas lurida]AOE82006.1 hypothetical protein A7318_26450 [Pseudomonas lurida]
MKEFNVGDYLNSEADIQSMLEIVIEDQNELILITCIQAIAKLKKVDLDPIDSFDSVSRALKAIGYKFVVEKSKP